MGKARTEILYLQGFQPFTGCKPILTITEERADERESLIQDVNNYANIAAKDTGAATLS